MVRCKFRCLEVTRRFSAFATKTTPAGLETDYDAPQVQISVRLVPVQHKGSDENASFWKATPSGDLTMVITNPAAALQFEPGRCYYLDMSGAPE